MDGIDFIDVMVTGRYVSPGNLPGTVGIEGDRVGFALAVEELKSILSTTLMVMLMGFRMNKIIAHLPTHTDGIWMEMDVSTTRMRTE